MADPSLLQSFAEDECVKVCRKVSPYKGVECLSSLVLNSGSPSIVQQ